jgi:Xaa-Pro dipeptidase
MHRISKGNFSVHQEQRQKTIDLLKSKNIERALFASFDSVKWLTGFAPSIESGFSLFMGAPFMVWYDAGQFTLITLDQYASEAEAFAKEANCAVVAYAGYTIEQPIASADTMADALRGVLSGTKGSGTIGVEFNHVSGRALQVLQDVAGSSASFAPIDNWLVPHRMVKTAEELAKLRRAFQLTDIGHQAAGAATQVGATEIEVWMAAQTAINRAAGYRLPLGNDTVVGYRNPNNIGGSPVDYVLHEDTSLIVDLSVIYQGYWSDSCNTYYPVAPTPKQQELHRYALQALDYATSLLKPGVKVNEIDQKVRAFMAKGGYTVYPHHTGHGVGVSGHEEPRIVPYNETPLEAGMVIMLEPGIYFPGETSVRLEDALLITQDGVERLTSHIYRG